MRIIYTNEEIVDRMLTAVDRFEKSALEAFDGDFLEGNLTAIYGIRGVVKAFIEDE